MQILLYVLTYVLAHFIFYCYKGRNFKVLQTENGIFAFHFYSFCFLGLISLVMSYNLTSNSVLPIFMICCGLHGIYSLSFLEMWSLSQGGFSVGVLQSAPITLDGNSLVLHKLENIGDIKFASRIGSLNKLGLIRQVDNNIYLTTIGSIGTKFFYLIGKLTNIKDAG